MANDDGDELRGSFRVLLRASIRLSRGESWPLQVRAGALVVLWWRYKMSTVDVKRYVTSFVDGAM